MALVGVQFTVQGLNHFEKITKRDAILSQKCCWAHLLHSAPTCIPFKRSFSRSTHSDIWLMPLGMHYSKLPTPWSAAENFVCEAKFNICQEPSALIYSHNEARYYFQEFRHYYVWIRIKKSTWIKTGTSKVHEHSWLLEGCTYVRVSKGSALLCYVMLLSAAPKKGSSNFGSVQTWYQRAPWVIQSQVSSIKFTRSDLACTSTFVFQSSSQYTIRVACSVCTGIIWGTVEYWNSCYPAVNMNDTFPECWIHSLRFSILNLH